MRITCCSPLDKLSWVLPIETVRLKKKNKTKYLFIVQSWTKVNHCL